jgi:hypothetical protein
MVAGFLLSPLSWWNDLYFNIPLAYALASPVSLIYKPAFLNAFILFYWLTNLAGFIMMHKGAERVLINKTGSYSKRAILVDIAWSLGYTIVIIIMVKLNIIRPVTEYF